MAAIRKYKEVLEEARMELKGVFEGMEEERDKERKVKLLVKKDNAVAYEKIRAKQDEFEVMLGGKLQFTEQNLMWFVGTE